MPGYYLDFNTVENLWRIIEREVYRHNKQSQTKEQLKLAIYKAWSNIKKSTLEKLAESMPHRLILTVKNQGGSIDN